MWPGSQLDAVGPLQLLDPVVLDGDAVPRGQLVVLPGAGTILVRQDGRQLLEVGFQSARRQDLDHPRRGVVGVPHGMRRPTGLHQGGARARQQHAVADADPDLAGQHQRELVLPGMVVWLHQGPRRDLDLEHSHAPAGIGAFDLVVEPHAEELDGLAFPRCHHLGARGSGHCGPPWLRWVRVCLPPWSVLNDTSAAAWCRRADSRRRAAWPGHEGGLVGAAPHDGVGARTGRQQPSVPSTCPEERPRAVNSGQPWHLPYRFWADHSAWTSTTFASRQCFPSSRYSE